MEKDKWILLEERLPENNNYILVSFENFPHPDVGRYETDKDGNGTCLPKNICIQGISANKRYSVRVTPAGPCKHGCNREILHLRRYCSRQKNGKHCIGGIECHLDKAGKTTMNVELEMKIEFC